MNSRGAPAERDYSFPGGEEKAAGTDESQGSTNGLKGKDGHFFWYSLPLQEMCKCHIVGPQDLRQDNRPKG